MCLKVEMNVSEGLARDVMETAYQLPSWPFSWDAATVCTAGAAEARAAMPVRMTVVLMAVAVLEEPGPFDGCVDEDGLSGYGRWMENGEIGWNGMMMWRREMEHNGRRPV
jgi:hypothetical protein